MNKTARLVVLMEPKLLKRIKQSAKKSFQTTSYLVRDSLIHYLQERAAMRKTKKLRSLGKYRMSLKGIEDIDKLNMIFTEES